MTSVRNTFQTRIAPLTSIVCALVATAWLREFGDGLISGPQVGWALSTVSAIVSIIVLACQWEGPPTRRALVAILSCVVVVIILPYWISRVGAYAVPHVPDTVGLLFCLVSTATGISLLVKPKWLSIVSLVSIPLGIYVLVTAFLYDPLTRSPYFTARRFAAAAYRCDQQAMLPFFSNESLEHFAELPEVQFGNNDGVYPRKLKTVNHMHGIAARNALLLKIDITGSRATVNCVVPWAWNLFMVRGHGGRIHLVREGGQWKVDVYTDFQELIQGMKQIDEGLR